MSRSNHPIEQEELMAYLDGELATNRAVEAAAHLEHCAECQKLADDFRRLSQEMVAWEMEPSEAGEIPADIAVALEKREKQPNKRSLIRKPIVNRQTWKGFLIRRWQWLPGLTALGLIVFLFLAPRFSSHRQPSTPMRGFYSLPQNEQAASNAPGYTDRASSASGNLSMNGNSVSDGSMSSYAGKVKPAPPPNTTTYAYDSLSKLSKNDSEFAYTAPGLVSNAGVATKATTGNESGSEDEQGESAEHTVPTVPMIARTAALSLTTKEFEKARAALEEILKRHNGYIGELNVSAPAEAGRTLTAVLRIPAQQLEPAMAELKALGRVEGESQGGEEVTQQYVDLAARLENGKHTEQRLTEILRTRTGKLQDVLKVELEIDRVRGEIEQMQAEKKELAKHVAFATLNTTVKEEYLARLQAAPPTTSSRFRNAAVDGYNTVVEGFIDVGLFLLSSGPSLLIWAAILFFPARWAWIKLRTKFPLPSSGDAEEEKS